MIKQEVKAALDKYRDSPVQVRATVWFLVCSFLQKGISTLTTPIFTRLLSPAEYGQYSIFNSWLGIVSVFVTLNLAAGIYMQGLVKYEDEQDVYSSSLQGLTLTLCIMWGVIYFLFRERWNAIFSLTTLQSSLMLFMCWTTAVFSFWASEQRLVYGYKKLVTVTLLVSVAKPLVSILLVVNAEDKVTARIIGLFVVELIGYGWCFFAQVKKGKKLVSLKFWRNSIVMAIPLIPHYLAQTVLSSADRIMIERYVGEAEAGVYSLAYSASFVVSLFHVALMQTLSPWIYRKIKEGKTDEIADISYPLLTLIGLLCLALIACAPEIIALFAPSSYYDAIWVIPPVAMSTFFVFAYEFFGKYEFYYEKTKFIMCASVIAAGLNILLNFIFIPRVGYYAAGYTTLACYIIFALGHYCCMCKICKQNFPAARGYSLMKLLCITGSFLSCGFGFLATYSITWLRYVFLFIILLALFILRKLMISNIKKVFLERKG